MNKHCLRLFRPHYESRMASNGKANNPTSDLEANETTGLLVEEDASSTGTTRSQEDSLFDEMDRPWPATFERSISLLASPIIKEEEVSRYTKSPKPGNTPLALRRRLVSVMNRLLCLSVYSEEKQSQYFSILPTACTTNSTRDFTKTFSA
jgi:hypothetical protein